MTKLLLGKDHFGNSLYEGDVVMFSSEDNREFIRGTLVSGGPTTGTVRHEPDGYGRTQVRLPYGLMIKLQSDK